ncbi:unnamed protein product, partial [Adineta steineri]
MKRINCSTNTSLDDTASDNATKRKCIEHNTNNRNSTITTVDDDESCSTTSNFIDRILPLKEDSKSNFEFVDEQFEQHMAFFRNNSNILSTTALNNRMNNDLNSFTISAFLDLETKVYGENWAIPCTREEPLGECLLSATKLALV